MSKEKTSEVCDCDGGIVWLSEADILGELKANQGTGKSITFDFGFGGKERTWRKCTKCADGRGVQDAAR